MVRLWAPQMSQCTHLQVLFTVNLRHAEMLVYTVDKCNINVNVLMKKSNVLHMDIF